MREEIERRRGLVNKTVESGLVEIAAQFPRFVANNGQASERLIT